MKAARTQLQPEKRHYLPALRGVFGDWVYYSCLMPLSEVATRIQFAETIIRRSERLSEWIQREIKKGRAQDIASYLLRDEQRFFNSLVVAIHGGDPAWHGFSNFRPESNDIRLREVPEDVEESVGFLSFTGKEAIFALDGQHRLAGIKEALSKDPNLGREDVSIIVVAHKTTKEGRERTRRLFTTLNKTAVPVNKGEIIALDENDVMAIVTRNLVEDSTYLGEKRIKFSATENLDVDALEFTTIGNLYDVLSEIFSAVGGVKSKELRFKKYSSESIAEYVTLANSFFSGLAAVTPPLAQYFTSSKDKAEKIVKQLRSRSGGHVVFRPIGLRILSEVVAILVRMGSSLEDAIAVLALLPTDLSKKPYRDVIWLPNGKMNPAGRAICRRVLLYMLGYEKRSEDLRKRYAKLLGVDAAALPNQVNKVL